MVGQGSPLQEKPLPAFRSELRFVTHGDLHGVWYALEEPQSGRYWRLGRMEYLIASALNGRRTLSDIETLLAGTNPATPYTRDQLCSVLTWIVSQGLTSSPNSSTRNHPPPGSTASKEQAAAHGHGPATHAAAAWDPFIIKLPLIPGAAVERVAKIFVGLYSIPALIIACLLVVSATAMVVSNPNEVFRLSNRLFVADSQLWWLLAWFVLKIVHELGHASSALRVGSQIRSAGIHILFFAPVPYVDMTDLWSITNRWQRILCSSAGILFEVVVAALAAIVAMTVEHEGLQHFAAAVATMGTVTTIGFNANPLMKFDGYFVLSDLLGRPKLWSEAQAALTRGVKTLVWPWREHVGRFTWTLASYGLLCFCYRIVMLLTLAWWALTVWHGVGVLLVGWAVYNWIVHPLLRRWKASRALAIDPIAARRHRRDTCLGLALSSALITIGLLLPSPLHTSVPGIVGYREPCVLRNEAPGFLIEALAVDRQQVKAGELLARLSNDSLESDLKAKQIEAAIAREKSLVLRARGELANSQAEQANLQSLEEQIAQLQSHARGLEIRAPRAGMLLADWHNSIGQYFDVGRPLGMIVDSSSLEVKGSTSQRDCAAMLHNVGYDVNVRASDGHQGLARLEKVSTRGEDQLEEPALAAIHGGPIPVQMSEDADGSQVLKLSQPRFAIHACIAADQAPNWRPGQVVWVSIPQERYSLGHWLGRWLWDWWDGVTQKRAAT